MLEFLGTSKHHFLGPFFFFFASSDCAGVCTRFHESEITWEFSLECTTAATGKFFLFTDHSGGQWQNAVGTMS